MGGGSASTTQRDRCGLPSDTLAADFSAVGASISHVSRWKSSFSGGKCDIINKPVNLPLLLTGEIPDDVFFLEMC